jgi:hypothetical protein
MGRFRYQSALVILSAAVAAVALAQSTFKVDVKLVRLLVTVKDSKGTLMGSLEKPDFAVYDSGVKQEVAVFEHHTALPLSVALLIDTSGSTATNLRYETTSLEKFLRALLREGNPDDSVALYAFNDEVIRLNSFTRREERLNESLRTLKARAGTSLYDAIHLASRELNGREGRHVIVAVTDGGDTTSVKKYADAFESAQNVDAILYPILPVETWAASARSTVWLPAPAGAYSSPWEPRNWTKRSRRSCATCARNIWWDIIRAMCRRMRPVFTLYVWSFLAKICGPPRAPATMGMRLAKRVTPWLPPAKPKHPSKPSRSRDTCGIWPRTRFPSACG